VFGFWQTAAVTIPLLDDEIREAIIELIGAMCTYTGAENYLKKNSHFSAKSRKQRSGIFLAS
jgi:hypothetical protein